MKKNPDKSGFNLPAAAGLDYLHKSSNNCASLVLGRASRSSLPRFRKSE